MTSRLHSLLLCGMAALSYVQAFSLTTPAQPNFTIRDSIEMKVFSDPYTRTPGATAKQAPDGRGFVVVTTQGHVESNTLESSLWYFSRQELENFLDLKQFAPPQPQLLFRASGVPEAKQWMPYGSLITDVQWSSDSRSLLFLVEKAHGMRHLYQTGIGRSAAVDITSDEKGDVSEPVSHAGTLVYLVSPPRHPVHDESYVASAVLTGEPLQHILFPEVYPTTHSIGKSWTMRIRFHSKTSSIPSGGKEYFPNAAVQMFYPSIAPNGTSILTAIPVKDVPPSWSAYRSANVTRHFVPSSPSSDHSGRDLLWPWQYALVNLVTGETRPLVNAPTGFTTAYADPFLARWSHSGETVIITNTYLPLDPVRYYADDSVAPCAIAEYTVKTHTVSCLAITSPPEQAEHLMSVDYDSMDNIAAQWVIHGNQVSRKYERSSQKWASIEAIPRQQKSIEIYIRQDMDVPPTLWVRKGSEDRQLWDPNPQLKGVQFGKASPYEWTDSSNYTWHAGLVLPAGPKPKEGYPLVIQTHGFYNAHEFLVDGAFTTGYAAQPLACAGVAVLQMEDRPDKRSRPAQEEANDAVRGIESAIDHLATAQIIDRSRIGILGFSRTHWYVEKALEHSPQRYKAAVMIDGVDQSYMQDVIIVPGNPTVAREEDEGANGAPPFGPGLLKWMQNAAGFNLDKVSTPVRLEAIGPLSVLGEWETYSILHQQGKPVDLIEIPHGQHILQKPKERYASQQGAVDWFRFWLQDYMRPSLETLGAYERWSAFKSSATHSNKSPGSTKSQ